MLHSDTRQRLVSLVHEVYYQAFANAVVHIDPEVEMFSREDFKKEVTRLAVYCGLMALQATRDSMEQNILLFSQFYTENIFKRKIRECRSEGGAVSQRRMFRDRCFGFIQ